MPLIDDRGRVFGKVNLIDAAVVIVILGLIPLGYASWGLFKTPATKLSVAKPTQIRANEADQRIDVTGVGLRPYLRIFVGEGTTSTKYLFDTPTHAEVVLPALAPGTYDLTVYDETMELSRLAKVITAIATPPPVVTSVTPSVLEFLTAPQHIVLKGERFSPSLKAMVGSVAVTYRADSAEKVELTTVGLSPGTYDLTLSDAVQELVRVPKAITVSGPAIESVMPNVIDAGLITNRVVFTGKHFMPNMRVLVGWREVSPQFLSSGVGEMQLPPYPAGSYDLVFLDVTGGREFARLRNAITARAPETASVTMRVRFLMRPEVLATIKQAPASPASASAALLSYESAGPELVGTSKAELKEGPMIVVNGVVRVQAARKPEGFVFETQELKAGAPFILSTPTYRINGEILGIDAPPARIK